MRRAPALMLGILAPLLLAGQSPRYPLIELPELPAGLGIAQVMPQPGGLLHFYRSPDDGELPGDFPPSESVRFGHGEPGVEISEAPPWLVPDHLKMDYEIFYLRAITLSPNWMEVIGNSRTGETVWIARDSVRFIPWAEFLLQVNSVQAFEGQKIVVRARPMDSGSPVLAEVPAALSPLAVQGEWLRVAKGWVRWRRGDRLLVRYNPLS